VEADYADHLVDVDDRNLESGEAKGELLLAAVAWPSERWPEQAERAPT
jgi:hypothetical protein